jgi:hypothetical protein
MWIPCRQHWVLWRLGRRLRRSDPHLAAMLVIFTRLTAGEAINSREQAAAIGDWVRGGLARLGRAVAVTAVRLRACARRARRRLRCAWSTARRRFSVHRAVGLAPPAGKPGEPKGRRD